MKSTYDPTLIAMPVPCFGNNVQADIALIRAVADKSKGNVKRKRTFGLATPQDRLKRYVLASFIAILTIAFYVACIRQYIVN